MVNFVEEINKNKYASYAEVCEGESSRTSADGMFIKTPSEIKVQVRRLYRELHPTPVIVKAPVVEDLEWASAADAVFPVPFSTSLCHNKSWDRLIKAPQYKQFCSRVNPTTDQFGIPFNCRNARSSNSIPTVSRASLNKKSTFPVLINSFSRVDSLQQSTEPKLSPRYSLDFIKKMMYYRELNYVLNIFYRKYSNTLPLEDRIIVVKIIKLLVACSVVKNRHYATWCVTIRNLVLLCKNNRNKLLDLLSALPKTQQMDSYDVVRELAVTVGLTYANPVLGVLWICRNFVFKSVSDSIVQHNPINQSLNDSLTKVSTKLENKIDEIGERVKDIITPSNENFATTMLQHSLKNPLAIGAALLELFKSSTLGEFTSRAIITCGLIGMEKVIIDRVMSRFLGFKTFKNNLPREQAGLGVNKKYIYMAGLFANIFGFETGTYKDSILEYIPKSHIAAKQIGECIEAVEDVLHELGLVTSPRMEALEQVQNRITFCIEELAAYDVMYNARPTSFISPVVWNKFSALRQTITELEKDLSTQRYKDLISTNANAEIIKLSNMCRDLNRKIQEVRDSVGIRMTPVGICIMGESQIGKSHLQTDLITRLKELIVKDLEDQTIDADYMALLSDVENWVVWDQNTRDEYDEGYQGQQIHSIDDMFTKLDHSDHPSMLNFVSCKKLPTKQAELFCKGRPYDARIFIASCNKPPTSSTTISNLDALYNRFHIFVHATLTGDISEEFDGSYRHLTFHVGTGADWYNMNVGGNPAVPGGCNSCGCKTLPYSEPGIVPLVKTTASGSWGSHIDYLAHTVKNKLYLHAKMHWQRMQISQGLPHNPTTQSAPHPLCNIAYPQYMNNNSPSHVRLASNLLSNSACSNDKLFIFDSLCSALRVSGVITSVNDLIVRCPPLRWCKLHLTDTPHPISGELNSYINVRELDAIFKSQDDTYNAPLFLLNNLNCLQVPSAKVDLELPVINDFIQHSNLALVDIATGMAFLWNPLFGLIRLDQIINKEEILVDHNWVIAFMIAEGYLPTSFDHVAYPEFFNYKRTIEDREGFGGSAEQAEFIKTWKHFFTSSGSNPYNPRTEYSNWRDFEIDYIVGTARHCWENLYAGTEQFDDVNNIFLRTYFKGSRLILNTYASFIHCSVNFIRFLATSFTEPIVRCLISLGNLLGFDLSESLDTLQAIFCAATTATFGVWIPLAVMGVIITTLCTLINLVMGKGKELVVGKPKEEIISESKVEESRTDGPKTTATRKIRLRNRHDPSKGLIRRFHNKLFSKIQNQAILNPIEQSQSFEFQAINVDNLIKPFYSRAEIKNVRDNYPTTNLNFNMSLLKGNIFSPQNHPGVPRVHCVAKDCEMGAGIASSIRRACPDYHQEISEQKDSFTVPDIYCGPCRINGMDFDLISLITKEKSSDKPTLKNYEASLILLRDLMKSEQIPHVVVPCIGMGCDKIPMDIALRIIYKVFNGTNLQLTMNFRNIMLDGLGYDVSKCAYVQSNVSIMLDSLDYDDIFYYDTPTDITRAIRERPLIFYGNAKDLEAREMDIKTNKHFIRVVNTTSLNGFVQYLMEVCEWLIENKISHVYIPEICVDQKWFTSDYAWFLLFILGDNLLYSNLGIYPADTFSYQQISTILFDQNLLIHNNPENNIIKGKYQDRQIDPSSHVLMKIMRNKLLIGVSPLASAEDYYLLGSQLMGWGYKEYVLAPAHMVPKSLIPSLKEKPLYFSLAKPNLNNVSPLSNPSELSFGKLVALDSDRDQCLIKLCNSSEIKTLKAQLKCDDSILKKIVTWPQFSNFVHNHVASRSWLEQNQKCFDIIQYLPNNDSQILGFTQVKINQTITIFDERSKSNVAVRRSGFEMVGYATTGCPTQAGDCGGPIIATNSQVQHKLLGMHIIGSSDFAFANFVCKEDIDDLIVQAGLPTEQGKTLTSIIDGFPEIVVAQDLFKKHNLESLIDRTDKDPVNKPLGPNVEILGTLTVPNHPTSFSKGSNLKPAPFRGIFEETSQPSVTKMTDKRLTDPSGLLSDGLGKPSILVTQISKFAQADNSNIDLDILNHIVETTINRDVDLFISHSMNISSPQELPEIYEEVLNGDKMIPYHEKMELRASSGIPWNCFPNYHKKSAFVDVDEIGHISLKENDEMVKSLKNLFEDKLSAGQLGMSVPALWKDCLKDEHRPLQAIAIGKTRTFCAGPMEEIMLIRHLFGRYKACYTKLGVLKDHAIGTDCLSSDWTKIANHLNIHANFGDADFSNFDRKIPPAILKAAFMIIIKTIQKVHPEDKWHRNREVAVYDMLHTYMCGSDAVYRTNRGNKSGNPLTSVVNCIVNFIYHWYAFIKITGEYSYAEFRANVSLIFYGDDVAYSVSEKYFDQFNFYSLKQIFESDLEQIYTPADKYGSGEFASKLEDITFLKRKFKQINNTFWMSPIEKQSIERHFNYSQVAYTDIENWAVLLNESLLEAAQHGHIYYNEFVNKFITALTDRKFRKQVPYALRLRASDILLQSYEVKYRHLLQRFGVSA